MSEKMSHEKIAVIATIVIAVVVGLYLWGQDRSEKQKARAKEKRELRLKEEDRIIQTGPQVISSGQTPTGTVTMVKIPFRDPDIHFLDYRICTIFKPNVGSPVMTCEDDAPTNQEYENEPVDDGRYCSGRYC
jgi:hypothetical protein